MVQKQTKLARGIFVFSVLLFLGVGQAQASTSETGSVRRTSLLDVIQAARSAARSIAGTLPLDFRIESLPTPKRGQEIPLAILGTKDGSEPTIGGSKILSAYAFMDNGELKIMAQLPKEGGGVRWVQLSPKVLKAGTASGSHPVTPFMSIGDAMKERKMPVTSTTVTVHDYRRGVTTKLPNVVTRTKNGDFITIDSPHIPDPGNSRAVLGKTNWVDPKIFDGLSELHVFPGLGELAKRGKSLWEYKRVAGGLESTLTFETTQTELDKVLDVAISLEKKRAFSPLLDAMDQSRRHLDFLAQDRIRAAEEQGKVGPRYADRVPHHTYTGTSRFKGGGVPVAQLASPPTQEEERLAAKETAAKAEAIRHTEKR